MSLNRCDWCKDGALYQNYHDNEWGEPHYDEAYLFELFILETQQAGLSWFTILQKREGYREAFAHFDPTVIATFDETNVNELVQNPNIIRHRGKIEAIIHNSRTYLQFCEKYDSFSTYLWGLVDNKPILNQFESTKEIPTKTALSDQISRDFKKFGFKFFGSVTCYAYLQAIGIVNDHVRQCHLFRER